MSNSFVFANIHRTFTPRNIIDWKTEIGYASLSATTRFVVAWKRKGAAKNKGNGCVVGRFEVDEKIIFVILAFA